MKFALALVWFMFSTPDAQAMVCANRNAFSGAIQTTSEQPPNCDTYLIYSQADFEEIKNANPLNTAPDYGTVKWAFGASVILWCLGLALGIFISTIKRAR